MAVTAALFTTWQAKLAKGSTGGAWTAAGGWASSGGDSIKCALVTTTEIGLCVTNRETYTVWSDVSAGEITNTSGTGYTAGGVVVTPRTISAAQSTPSLHTIAFLGTVPAWTSSSFTAGGAVFYNTASPTAANGLICYVNFGGDQVVASGTFTLTTDATNGIWCLSAA